MLLYVYMSNNKCERCRKDLVKRYFESRKVFSNRRFCSKICSNLSNPSTFKQGNKIRLGSKQTEDSKIKLSESQKRRYKELKEKGLQHHRWKGGYQNKLWHNRRRRVLKLKNGGSHTLEQWLNLKKEFNYTCLHCLKSESEIILTEDHIIPLRHGGTDDIENIQPLCKRCNSIKH